VVIAKVGGIFSHVETGIDLIDKGLTGLETLSTHNAMYSISFPNGIFTNKC
jgi:hypothetical protein